MFRKVEDFKTDYTEESRESLKNWDRLTDASLDTRPADGYWSIGEHLWHIAALWDYLFVNDIKHWSAECKPPETAPATAAELADYYRDATIRVCDWVAANWTDDDLAIELELWGMKMTRGKLLWEMVKHEAHHRGQIVSLMRIAGLPVHGIYGPSLEEAKATSSADGTSNS